MSRRLDHLSVEVREHLAENMKERIYATITLIALITALWQTADHHTAGGAIVSILGTVVALWLATLISARVSHRAVYGKSMRSGEVARLLFTSSGLFLPVVAPIIIITVSSLGFLSLGVALLASLITLLLSLFMLSFVTSRRIYDSWSRIIGISLLEMSVGVGVVVLKLVVGE